MPTLARLVLVLVFAAAACTPYDPHLPASPFLCGATEPKCPDGYTCVTTAGKAVCMDTTPTTQPPDAKVSGTCTSPFSGVLATWNLAGETGTQASSAAASTAPGVTATPLTRSIPLIAASGTGSINSTNWPLGSALDPMSYYTLSLAPPAGCTLALASIAIDVKSSGTGPSMAAIGTMADAFAQPTAISTSAPSMPTLTASVASGSLEIRVFGYGATAASGTMRIQNMLVISGALQ